MSKQKKSMLVLLVIMAFITPTLFLPGLVSSGSLEPAPDAIDGSGNPILTMHTLDEIYNKLEELVPTGLVHCGHAPVAKTGQNLYPYS